MRHPGKPSRFATPGDADVPGTGAWEPLPPALTHARPAARSGRMAAGSGRRSRRWAGPFVDETDPCATRLHMDVRVEVEDVAQDGQRDDSDDTDQEDSARGAPRRQPVLGGCSAGASTAFRADRRRDFGRSPRAAIAARTAMRTSRARMAADHATAIPATRSDASVRSQPIGSNCPVEPDSPRTRAVSAMNVRPNQIVAAARPVSVATRPDRRAARPSTPRSLRGSGRR